MLKKLGVYFSLGLIPGVMWLITISLLTHSLSPSAYGVGMLFVSSLELIGSLSGLGMDRVFIRFFYENGYRNKTALLLYFCLLCAGLSIVLIYSVSFFFTNRLSAIFHLNGIFIWILMLTGTIAFVLEIFASFMPRLQEKPGLYTLGQIAQQGVFLLSCASFILLSKKGSDIIMISQVMGLSCCSMLLIFIYKNEWKIPRHLLQHLKIQEIKKFISYGFPFIFSGSLTWAFFNIDKFLILRWSGSHTLGIYTAAFALCAPYEMLRSVFILGWIPILNKLIVESPFKGKKILHDTFQEITWFFTVGMSWMLLGKSIITLLLGKQFLPAENVYGWILLSIYFYCLSDIVSAGIIKSKKTYWNVIISIICLSVNISFCALLIPIYHAQGAAIANAISFFIFFLMRYGIGFYYYSFKIKLLKLLGYSFYLVLMIVLNGQSHLYLQLILYHGFLIASLFFEKDWLLLYYARKCRKPACRCA